MASFEKRGKTWRYVISYKDDLGQNKRIQKGGFSTKKEAQVHATDLEYNLKRGYDISNDVIFVDYFKQWYEINKKPHVSHSTLKRYISAYNYLKEYFNNKRIKDVKQSDYQQFLNEYGKSHNRETARKLNSYVRNACDQAIHEGLILRNPTYKATVTGANPSKSEDLKFINHTDYVKLKHFLEQKNTTSALVLLMALVTGGRFSEIANMKRDDFFLSDNKIHLPGTKTETSDRVISIDTNTLNKVKHYINDKTANMNGYVFTINGAIISNTAVNKVLRKTCNHLNIKEVTINALRHTHASVLIHNGFSLHYISKRLGHASTLVTQSVYLHLLEETYAREDKNMIEFLNNL